MGRSGQRRRTTGERFRRRLARRHGMSDRVETVRILPGTGAMPARGAYEPHVRVKVGRRRKGSWGTCERVEDIRCDAPVIGAP